MPPSVVYVTAPDDDADAALDLAQRTQAEQADLQEALTTHKKTQQWLIYGVIALSALALVAMVSLAMRRR